MIQQIDVYEFTSVDIALGVDECARQCSAEPTCGFFSVKLAGICRLTATCSEECQSKSCTMTRWQSYKLLRDAAPVPAPVPTPVPTVPAPVPTPVPTVPAPVPTQEETPPYELFMADIVCPDE